MSASGTKKELTFDGIAASPGVSIGIATVLTRESLEFPRKEISKNEVEKEIKRFKEALKETRKQLESIKKRVLNRLGEKAAELFDAHLLILDDKIVVDEALKRIREECRNAEWVYFEIMQDFHDAMSDIDDEYMRERGVDILDVKRRVIRNLTGRKSLSVTDLKGMRIIVCHQLTPSQMVMLDRNAILGLAVDLGGRTSHAVILARGLEKPAVVGLKRFSENVKDGDRLIIDGSKGRVILNPAKGSLLKYRALQEKYQKFQQALLPIKELPAKTLDGREFRLAANIDFPAEVESALAHGANGVGLFRTEYIYLNKSELPSEEEQLQEYQYIADQNYPNAVRIRTFDLGGDRMGLDAESDEEENPFLGWRSIRISLDTPDLFLKQLRAILRSSGRQNVRIMFPMISSFEELIQSKEYVRKAMAELEAEGVPFDPHIEVGMMIEVPSAVMMADQLAKEVSFFSIGTNDLIQYTLAVDRGNERIAKLYTNYHPAVLRMIKETVEIGHRNGIWVALCGEMACDLQVVPFLVGIGLDELSVTSPLIPEVKKLIRSLRYNTTKRLCEDIPRCSTAKQVEESLQEFMQSELPEISEVLLPEVENNKQTVEG
ncbi:MAG: phosphoenolpyruvate--protein phosphotransferase [bacterium]